VRTFENATMSTVVLAMPILASSKRERPSADS
jgi:hypothetical protein